MRTDPLGLALLAIARNAIEKELGLKPRTVTPHPDLAKVYLGLRPGDSVRDRLARAEADEFTTTDHPRFVLGSVGPGTKLPTLGHVTFAAVRDAYQRQVAGMLRGGIDAVQIETCQDLLQAKAAVIGAKPVPRTEVTKKVWEYIKKNKLQDEVNKRMINADAKLKEIFKKAQASMFEMTKLVNDHLK